MHLLHWFSIDSSQNGSLTTNVGHAESQEIVNNKSYRRKILIFMTLFATHWIHTSTAISHDSGHMTAGIMSHDSGHMTAGIMSHDNGYMTTDNMSHDICT